ncbi:MAG: flagellar basal-body rod protein FlgF [Syntrophomonadaceae bacterium]|nr:flagellar basal-body rod protein FlgF [Syntrophomonadaceae bacterium]MDH7498379.1 flagellar basal-body rod protein FlgF [Syntrophomonadaceae bacterium]
MIRGLYTACSGMLLQAARQDVIANNVANAGTAGFRRDDVVCSSFPQLLMYRAGESGGSRVAPIGKLGTGAAVTMTRTDSSAGLLQRTERGLDVAIGGAGYLVLQTPGGSLFTRDGALQVGADGFLQNRQGYPVLGDKGPIAVGAGEVAIDAEGVVTVDGKPAGKLRVVTLPQPAQLRKVGGNALAADQAAVEEVAHPNLMAGYLEASNVNAVREMVDLIAVLRAYEANQKVVQAHDHTLEAAVNRVGAL